MLRLVPIEDLASPFAAGTEDDAEALSRDLLPDMQTVLGPHHPDTLTTRANIASWTGETRGPRRCACTAHCSPPPGRPRPPPPRHGHPPPDRPLDRQDRGRCRLRRQLHRKRRTCDRHRTATNAKHSTRTPRNGRTETDDRPTGPTNRGGGNEQGADLRFCRSRLRGTRHNPHCAELRKRRVDHRGGRHACLPWDHYEGGPAHDHEVNHSYHSPTSRRLQPVSN